MPVRDAWMGCPDGTRLATRIWSPDPSGPHGPGPWPVLLMRQPYGRAIASTVTYAHPTWYAAQGFMVAVQDVRGRGASEGSFRGFRGEAPDGAAAVRWARGLEGADGRVGTYGFSYQGLTQLLQDPQGPGIDDGPDPLPDCLVPAMAGLDERRHWAAEGGAHWWGPALAWALQLAAEGCRRRGDGEGWRAIRASLASGNFLEEGPALLERLDPQGMGHGWLGLDPEDPSGWHRHRVEPALWRRPMLLIGGWHDPHLHGVLDLWQQARAAGGNPGLVVGCWTHLDWNGGLDALQLAFFRRHLPPRAGPAAPDPQPFPLPDPALAAALEGGIALELEGRRRWLQAAQAGPAALPAGRLAGRGGDTAAARAASRVPAAQPDGAGPEAAPCWCLSSRGLATIRDDEGRLLGAPVPPTSADRAEKQEAHGEQPSSPVILVHDPWRPLPARGGHLGQPAGPLDRADLDRRADVACFTADPEPRQRWLVGRPLLELVVAADQPGFDLCVALSRLPDGPDAGTEVRQISTGFARFRGPGAQQALLRRVELQPMALLLEPGERLRLSIGAAAWPAIAVNPGDGSLPRGGGGPDHRVISLRLDTATASLRLEPLLRLPAEGGRLSAP